MKILASILLLSFSIYATDRCHTGINKKYPVIARIFDFISNPSMDFCKPMSIGQKRIFNVSRKDSPTTVPHLYQLERVSENEYKIRFNIVFLDGENQTATSTRSKAYTQVWRREANKCLDQVKDKIKGPNGEKLTLEVDENKEKSKIPRVRVELKESGRANSREWVKTMPCSTILHELLHVTGLVDEYHETSKGIVVDPLTGKHKHVKEGAEKPAYDCRKVGKENSIMHTQEIKWENVFGKWKRKSSVCICATEKSKCEAYVANNLNTLFSECPEGFKISEQYDRTELSMSNERIPPGYIKAFNLPKNEAVDFWNDKLVIEHITPNSDAANDSILDEKHWNAIIYPGCLAKNADYYQDASNSKRTSIENGGKGCIDYSSLTSRAKTQ